MCVRMGSRHEKQREQQRAGRKERHDTNTRDGGISLFVCLFTLRGKTSVRNLLSSSSSKGSDAAADSYYGWPEAEPSSSFSAFLIFLLPEIPDHERSQSLYSLSLFTRSGILSLFFHTNGVRQKQRRERERESNDDEIPWRRGESWKGGKKLLPPIMRGRALTPASEEKREREEREV